MEKLTHRWQQQKNHVDQNETAATKQGQQFNLGKRRLGRFPISGSSICVDRKKHQSPSESLHKPVISENSVKTNNDVPAFSSTFFSTSIDDDLLVEVERMEAEGFISINQGASEKELSAASKDDSCTISLKDKRGQSTKAYLDDVLDKTNYITSGTEKSIGKRKHVNSRCKSNVVTHLISGSRLKTQLKNSTELYNYNSPCSSPLDKKAKCKESTPRKDLNRKTPLSFTKIKSKVDDIDSSKKQPNSKTPNRLTVNQTMDDNFLNCSDISFSPLCSTPGEMSLLTEESIQSTPKAVVRKIFKKKTEAVISKKSPGNVSVENRSLNIQKQKSPTGDNPYCQYSRNSLIGKKRSSPNDPMGNSSKRLIKVKQSMKENSNCGEVLSSLTVPSKTEIRTKLETNVVSNGTQSKITVTNTKEPSPSRSNRQVERESVCSKVAGESCSSEIMQSKVQAAESPPMNSSVSLSLTEDKRHLSSWGLPGPVLEAYHKQKITTMFEWQADCLLTGNVLDGGNLVYSAPTSAGKTLVAELLMLKRVLETRKKALLILPFVSVAREKMYSLQALLQDAGVRVGGFMGNYSPAGGLNNLDIAVCTIEKGNGLINKLMEEGRVHEIGVVVIDELHMVGDNHRGYLLELMLTKLAFITQNSELQEKPNVQLIGMSATLPNLHLLASWLNASLYHTDFRPVPLKEHIKIGTRIYDSQMVDLREISASYIYPDDADHVVALCLETVSEGNAVLVFCPTKNWCEKLCETVARKFYSLRSAQRTQGGEAQELVPLSQEKVNETVEQLRRCPVGADAMIARCVLNGVAYHHAGLTFDERDIIEGSFRQGHIKVLVATSTLSSGVNLPARRVIIRTPIFHGQVLESLTYKQMVGRAGRKGVDTEGESIIICKANEKVKGKNLLQSELPEVESCLHFDPEAGLSGSLKRAILEVVVSGVASSPEEVVRYVQCTLLWASLRQGNKEEQGAVDKLVSSCVQYLLDNEFVTVHTETGPDGTEKKKFTASQLGAAILASSLSPDEGLMVFSELQKARRSFVLDTELHIIYLISPVYSTDVSANIDWYHYHALWEALTPADRRVAELVGVSEAFIVRAIQGRVNGKTDAQKKSLAIHRRFYTALVLNTLVQEVPLLEVAARFNCNKGQLQSLQQSAATYAGMITVFCGRLGWRNLELLLSQFQNRLSSGVQQELVDLVRISALNASSARMLYNAGYQSVAEVAKADVHSVENLFKKAAPFQSEKCQDGESAWEVKERSRARCIWLTGRKGVTELEAASAIIEEAKVIVQGDLGMAHIVWEEEKHSEIDNNVSDDESEKSSSSSNSVVKAAVEIQCRKHSPANTDHLGINEQESGNVDDKTRLENHLQTEKSRNEKENICYKEGQKKALVSTLSTEKVIETTPLCGESPELNSSNSKLHHKRSSQQKPMSSDSKKGSRSGNRRSGGKVSRERSFFGQLVVSPPPGVRTKSPLTAEVSSYTHEIAHTTALIENTNDFKKGAKNTDPINLDLPANNESQKSSGIKESEKKASVISLPVVNCNARKDKEQSELTPQRTGLRSRVSRLKGQNMEVVTRNDFEETPKINISKHSRRESGMMRKVLKEKMANSDLDLEAKDAVQCGRSRLANDKRVIESQEKNDKRVIESQEKNDKIVIESQEKNDKIVIESQEKNDKRVIESQEKNDRRIEIRTEETSPSGSIPLSTSPSPQPSLTDSLFIGSMTGELESASSGQRQTSCDSNQNEVSAQQQHCSGIGDDNVETDQSTSYRNNQYLNKNGGSAIAISDHPDISKINQAKHIVKKTVPSKDRDTQSRGSQAENDTCTPQNTMHQETAVFSEPLFNSDERPREKKEYNLVNIDKPRCINFKNIHEVEVESLANSVVKKADSRIEKSPDLVPDLEEEEDPYLSLIAASDYGQLRLTESNVYTSHSSEDLGSSYTDLLGASMITSSHVDIREIGDKSNNDFENAESLQTQPCVDSKKSYSIGNMQENNFTERASRKVSKAFSHIHSEETESARNSARNAILPHEDISPEFCQPPSDVCSSDSVPRPSQEPLQLGEDEEALLAAFAESFTASPEVSTLSLRSASQRHSTPLNSEMHTQDCKSEVVCNTPTSSATGSRLKIKPKSGYLRSSSKPSNQENVSSGCSLDHRLMKKNSIQTSQLTKAKDATTSQQGKSKKNVATVSKSPERKEDTLVSSKGLKSSKNPEESVRPSPISLSGEFPMDSFSSSLMEQAIAGMENEEWSTSKNTTAKPSVQSKDIAFRNTANTVLKTNEPGESISNKSKDNNCSLNTSDTVPSPTSSHNNSDLVPPTPPEETMTSVMSPFKCSFNSPFKRRSKLANDTSVKCRNKASKNPSSLFGENFASEKLQNAGNSKAMMSNTEENLDSINKEAKSGKFKSSSSARERADARNTEYCQPHKIVASDETEVDSEDDNVDDHLHKSYNVNEIEDEDEHNESSVNALEANIDVDDQGLLASQLLTQQSFTIVDVCADQELFQTFVSECRDKTHFALALACERNAQQLNKKSPPARIGGRFLKKKSPHKSQEVSVVGGVPIENSDSVLVGVAISWEGRDAYFISLRPENTMVPSDPDDTLAEPPLDSSLTVEERLQALRDILLRDQSPTVSIYDTKSAYITLMTSVGVAPKNCQDPRVADWLRQPSARLKNLHRMVSTYALEELPLLEAVGGATGHIGPGRDVRSNVSGRLRACTEAVLTRTLMVQFRDVLEQDELWEAFSQVEMKSVITLARMELNGFGVSLPYLESQKAEMTSLLTSLEEQAYQMAGHPFSLTSTDDVAKVLYLELKLPLNGEPGTVARLPKRGASRRTTVGGTGKDILEKLQKFHPLPGVILEWRRLSAALVKSLFALQQQARHCPALDMQRVFADCQLFTATGRVSMAEPNIQNIPKDFTVNMKVADSIQDQINKSKDMSRMNGSNLNLSNSLKTSISMRKMFVPFQGAMILAADYSQLELRIICHLSGDRKLAKVLNQEGGDVFKMIAAQMKGLDKDEVTDEHRQQAKQVCYGMLYGIGPKALGEQLGVDMDEAAVFMETFKSQYPGVRRYLRETVEFCQKNGYVTTMFNRRRYLPSIKHNNPHARAHAERQAVNTTIQGSAADLVKVAMTRIDRDFQHMFPETRRAHSQKIITGSHSVPPRAGAYLVLQLHDELIYEVTSAHCMAVARLIKKRMESAVSLSVRMPVKVKAGPNWAELKELVIQ